MRVLKNISGRRRALLALTATLLAASLASPAHAGVCYKAYVAHIGPSTPQCLLGGGSTGHGVDEEDPVFGIKFGAGVWVSV